MYHCCPDSYHLYSCFHFILGKMLYLATPWTQGVNWTYIRPSEDVQDVFWSSYIRSIYVLCPGGMVLEMTLLSLCLEPSGNSFLTLLSLIVVLDRFRIFGKSFLQLNSISTSNHMFGRVIWDKLPECIFKNFENARVKGAQFQNFQKSRGWIIPKIARTKHMSTG